MKIMLILLIFGTNQGATIVDEFDSPTACIEASLEYEPSEKVFPRSIKNLSMGNFFFITCAGADEISEEEISKSLITHYGYNLK